jgi:hypothetical protein
LECQSPALLRLNNATASTAFNEKEKEKKNPERLQYYHPATGFMVCVDLVT